MKPVEFHPEATVELDAAVGYYEQCVPGLGIDLRKDVETAVQKIQADAFTLVALQQTNPTVSHPPFFLSGHLS